MNEREDTVLKTFNTAKLFAEKILFPMMDLYQTCQRQSDFGSPNLQDSVIMNEDIRNIERFNGLKGMADMALSLTKAIESTVRLKGNKKEIEQLMNIEDTLNKVKIIFYEHRHLFFKSVHKESGLIDVLERAYFESIKRIIQTCYTNTEILMTRNKLLFADSNDEFKSDEEIKEDIMKEYIDG